MHPPPMSPINYLLLPSENLTPTLLAKTNPSHFRLKSKNPIIIPFHFLGQYFSYIMICYFQCAISGFSKLISLQGGLIVGLLAWAGVRNWRTLMLVCSAPTGLIALLWFAIPESPRWLIAKGQWTLIPT